MTDLAQFVQDAIRTESLVDSVVVNEQLLQGTLKTLIATGNILDMIKKNVFYGKPIEARRLRELTLLANVGLMQIDPTTTPATPERELEDVNPRLFHAIVGIATEGTELLEALQKIINGENADNINIKEELGDVNWYEAIAIDTLEEDFESVLNTVIAKLKARFPEKFTSEDAIHRDLATERKILEG